MCTANQFITEADAYDDMRDAAMGKMKWNTEPEDFDDCDRIGYEVKFSPDTISHYSYSGTYVWHIVREGEKLTDEQMKEILKKIWKED